MARKSARDLWAAKLSGKDRTVAKSKSVGPVGRRGAFLGIVLGIDPSLRGTGLAIVRFEKGQKRRLLESLTVRNKPELSVPDCLGRISLEVTAILDRYAVDQVAVEETIYVQNFQTAQVLGATRGAAIAAVAVQGIPVFEYPPLRIKQAVVGFGRAGKEQVAKTVVSLLGHDVALEYDEADAAAVAICHAFTSIVE